MFSSCSFLFLAELVCPNLVIYSPAAGDMAQLQLMQIQSMSDRECQTLIVRGISTFLLRARPVGGGCSNLHK